MKRADNIVIDKDSVAESRRGFARLPFTLPSPGDRADKFSQYQNKLIVHYGTYGFGYYDSSTGVNAYAGSFAHPDPLLAKIRTTEANQNFYFTTSSGIYKLDAVTGIPVFAGMPAGLDITATASASGTGFMSNNVQVAYRMIWGFKDANKNLIIGAPSQRAVIANSSGGVQNVSLTATIPSGITTAHFFQLYRSTQSASSSTTPDDNMQLVYEGNPASGDITAKSLTVIDIVPDSLRGAALYTNDSQQGILQANTVPPYALDVATFKNCVFFGNIKTKMQLQFSILGVGGTTGIALNDTITIAGTTYTAKNTENVAALQYALATGGTPAQNINDSALSLVRVINQNSTNTSVYARYVSTTSGLPGQILIEERLLGGATYYATASAHGTAFSPALPTSGTTVPSTNNVALNGLMYSKQQIPEAVPTANILYCGSASKAILRIIALRESLLILKEDGVYRCTGTAPGNFAIDLLDNTAFLLAPESAVALSNRIFALTTQGVVQITDNGVEVISFPIEDQLTPLFGDPLSALKAYSFGVGYESARKYILWTVTSAGDTYGTQAFVYNIFTKAWTRWTRSQQHAIVLQYDDKLYAGDPLSENINQERKTLAQNSDYADEALPITISSFTGASIVLSDVTNVAIGDTVYQSDSILSVITAVDVPSLTVTVADTISNWSIGAASLLKAIACLVEWVPEVAQDGGMLKQYDEAMLLFKLGYFNNASMNFYSDVSGSVEKVPFAGISGNGWGRTAWGTGAPWGGVSNPQPFRTYIPLEKQRCDQLSVQFQVTNGRANFQLQGMALKVRAISERVAR